MLKVTKSLCFYFALWRCLPILYTTGMENTITHIKSWLGSGSINIFGRPFVGKNTQADRLVELFDGVLVASGDIFRAQKDNTELQQIMASGQNIPSEMFFDIMLPFFEKADFADQPLILSEVGRKNGEQELVLKATAEAGHPTKAVILLDMPEDVVWQRYEAAQAQGDRGHRPDDSNRDIIATRIERFRIDVLPVIDFYKQNNLLLVVDGTLPREEVTQNIIEALHSVATQ